MSSRYLMEPDEAHRQYERLIEVIASNNDLQGQAAALRTQFDTLLNLCVEAKLGSLPKDGKMNGFVVKINELFDTGWAKPGSLHKRLIELTSTFNNTSAHTYDQYKRLAQKNLKEANIQFFGPNSPAVQKDKYYKTLRGFVIAQLTNNKNEA